MCEREKERERRKKRERESFFFLFLSHILQQLSSPKTKQQKTISTTAALKLGGGDNNTDFDVAGRANVLVFPDLSSGNISYKAVQQATGAAAVGPVLQGLVAPVNDLSRGASVDDVVCTAAVTAVQAIAAAEEREKREREEQGNSRGGREAATASVASASAAVRA